MRSKASILFIAITVFFSLCLKAEESFAKEGRMIYEYMSAGASGYSTTEVEEIPEANGKVRFIYHDRHSSGIHKKKTLAKGCKKWTSKPVSCADGPLDDRACEEDDKQFAKEFREHLWSCGKVTWYLTDSVTLLRAPFGGR